MTNFEKETTIIFNDGEKVAHIYTASAKTMRKLDQLCEEYPDIYRQIDAHTFGGEVIAKDYVCSDKKLIRIARPRVLTDEQRKALSERGRLMAERMLDNNLS